MACGCIYRIFKWTIFIAIVVLLIRYWLSTKDYIFSHEGIAAVAKKHTGPDIVQSYDKIHKELLRRYPGHILPAEDLEWIFLNVGGWMGSMCAVHASLTEYVLFFGSAMETSGHSARYWANISDTVMSGTYRQWKEGSLSLTIYKPGDTVMHTMGEAAGVNFAAGTWMVEYGRGFIPSTLGPAIADILFSTHDFVSLFYMFRAYSKAMAMEAVHFVGHSQEYLQKLLS